MKKLIFCISLSLTGLMTACVDKNEAVDADSKPSWLGESIYRELKSPSNLEGEFTTYLRLIDDLGEAETFNRTGSKTIFPANDEAFKRFFQSNDWGVTSYEQLTTAQKQQLLYGSMLNNAMLVEMLSNVNDPNGTSSNISRDVKAMKHATNLSTVATVQFMPGDQLPKNNPYWDPYRSTGIYVVSDASSPMMVHFTRDHMLNNNITTKGDHSDFSVLTGTAYTDGMAYVYDNRIVKSDVTCQNGYIHQVEDVVVPPGNMSQVLRNSSNTKLFSRLVDYFSVPFANSSLTDAYNAWALGSGQPTIDDQIYEIKYFCGTGYPSAYRNTDVDVYWDPNNQPNNNRLTYNLGWNAYSPSGSSSSDGVERNLADVGAIFVPTDEALVKYFTKGGEGAYLIDLYGIYKDAQNDREHLEANLDALFNQKPEILKKYVNNLMKTSFVASVPSKFPTVLNDASEYMGMDTTLLARREDNGRFDIKFANNGVLYMINDVIGPDEYQSVMGPLPLYPDLSVMNWAVQDDAQLEVSFHYYLMAMKSNFAFFIPDNEAFSNYYVDPTSLGHRAEEQRVLKFTMEGDTTITTNENGETIITVTNEKIRCSAYAYNPVTNEVGGLLPNGANLAVSEWKSLFQDILNYHTVVLDNKNGVKEEIGTTTGNKYYKTKHGGEIYIEKPSEGGVVASGQQIDNGLTAPTITRVYPAKNGEAFRINRVIQGPVNSVSKTLQDNGFTEFHNFCAGFSYEEIMEWAGISTDRNNAFNTSEFDAYVIFTANQSDNSEEVNMQGNCLDENVKMFNTYNYTLYAPNNEAMRMAYEAGLPSWNDVQKLYEADPDPEDEGNAYKTQAKEMINIMRDFARYHFQSVSVYADQVIKDAGRKNSLCTDKYGLAVELNLSGGSGVLKVEDAAGVQHSIDSNASDAKTNIMAREFWFNTSKEKATEITTSSFCVVHELKAPLCSGEDAAWVKNLDAWKAKAANIYK